MNTALLLRMKAKPGQHDTLRNLVVETTQRASQHEPGITWFTLRFRRSELAIFAAFVDDTTRNAQATSVGMDLLERAEPRLSHRPTITTLEVLASKTPEHPTTSAPSTKAMLLQFDAKADHGQQVGDFLRDARRFALNEPDTTAWYAIREGDNYGIFDVFPNTRGRLKHFAGHIPRELLKQGHALLGSIPSLELPDVLASHITAPVPRSILTA
jgi:hypothetical protein